ncbi:uncharacterized protein LOC134318696 [Trichomycterus rosablanca]|uniref:uncharacterized protein LOC134318696 n=1 Tax=Trichomycterus rosablanca TaxID=2290929 RepID=UPI002F3507DC
MLMLMWITVVLFYKTVDPAQTNAVNQPDSVITATVGDNVTLLCFLLNKDRTDPIVWYKQTAGQELSLIATVQNDPSYEKDFKSSRFNITKKEKESCHLSIANVKISDEANYYCGSINYLTYFGKGTFLSVRDVHELKVSVSQNAVTAGELVNLQCSVISESRTSELRVLWFRSAAPQSRPQIIYTNHNSSDQCKNSSSTYTCVYNFSKNILTLSDTGTYYCAAVMCGKMIIGNGTTVQLEKSVDPLMICLAVALGVCVCVIAVQVVLNCKRRNYEQCRETITVTEKTSDQGHNAAGLNYAALHFSKAKNKSQRVNQQKDTVYSEVKHSTTP